MSYALQNFQQGIGGGTALNATRAQHIEDGIGTGLDLVEAVFPCGAIGYWPSVSAPTGWLECNGVSLLRASYPTLFAAIGTLYGAADGSHFSLPDYRGCFLRGLDDGRGVDSGRTLGSYQADDVKAHTHSTNSEHRIAIYNVSDYYNGSSSFPTGASRGYKNTDAQAASESRPKNIALMIIMKVV